MITKKIKFTAQFLHKKIRRKLEIISSTNSWLADSILKLKLLSACYKIEMFGGNTKCVKYQNYVTLFIQRIINFFEIKHWKLCQKGQ